MARVPAFANEGVRSESCRPEHVSPGARRDKNPGDLSGRDWQRGSLASFAVIKPDEDWTMKRFQILLTLVCAAAMLATAPVSDAFAAKKKEFNIAWTIYVGWMP